MVRLYELSHNYKNLVDLMDNPEIPRELIESSINEIDEQFEDKAENIVKVMKSLDLEANAIKEEEKRLSDRRKAIENRSANLKEYLDSSMRTVGKDRIKGKVFTVAFQKNAPSVDIENESLIPKEFIVLKEEISKKDILAALKEGKEVPGASIKQTESLRIR